MGEGMPATVECFTCHATITQGKGRQRKFCNQTCNNRYKGARTGYRKRTRTSDLIWPYGASEDDLVTRVNAAIPRNLPEQIRAEACQEYALALLEGREITVSDALRAARSGYQFSARMEYSMDIPMSATTQTPLRDLLASPRNDGQARIESDEQRLDLAL